MRCDVLVSLILSIAMLVAAWGTSAHKQPTEVLQPTHTLVLVQGCLSDDEISRTLQTLKYGESEDQRKAANRLKANAGHSPACRKQVITSLMSAMDQTNLDLTAGTPQFFLWHYGAQLFGDLKVTQALDLLIANFNRDDGSGFPLNHYPALGGVIRMGEIALPKLQMALLENPDSDIRRHAVFCIALIGGQSAHNILKQALARETDSCVASCIEATISAFNNRRRPHYIPDELRTNWYTTFLCNGK